MTERFHCPDPIELGRATLRDAEAHHARVMRLGVGDRVVVFDGRGQEFLAEVAGVSRHEVQLEVLEAHPIDRELPRLLRLAVALPKGDRQKWLVEKAVELGVAELVPVVAARGVAQPDGGAIARLERLVIEASKQCERNRLMRIGESRTWGELLAQFDGLRLFAHPDVRTDGGPAAVDLGAQIDASAGAVTIAVGPEGGFTPAEVAAAVAAGWARIDLGPRLLRIETAAIAVAAAVALRLR